MRKVLFISSTIVGSILSLLVQAKAQQVGQVQVNFEGFAGKVVESRASLLSISKVGGRPPAVRPRRARGGEQPPVVLNSPSSAS